MGAKVPKIPPPPAVDPEVATKEAESAAKLEAEKKKAISLRKKGVEEEAKTAATSLMQY